MSIKLSYEFEPVNFEIPMDDLADAAVDSKGNIYAMANGLEYPVCVFDSRGKFLYGWGNGLLKDCHGAFIDPDDNIYIVDAIDNVLSKFTTDGKLLMTIGNRGVYSDTGTEGTWGNYKEIKQGAGPFHAPAKVTVSPTGEIFVADGYANSRVHRFSADGTLIKSWGEPGVMPGQFNMPHGVGVDDENIVYVADRENDRVQVFDVEGNLKSVWNNIYRPDDLCVANGLVYVAELGHVLHVGNVMFNMYENRPWSQVRVFDLQGVEVARIGGSDGWKPGNMYAAHSINVDAEGNIYVGDCSWPDFELPKPKDLHPALQKFRRIG